MTSLYEKLSEERKQLQKEGRLPDWFTTAGWQMFKDKYLYQAEDFSGQVERISRTAARHARKLFGEEYDWQTEFYNLFWKGWLSASTPVLANMGTDRGLPVSCSGGYIEDSIDGFYKARHEAAMLTKFGFGTSAYLGDIRSRGSSISNGGRASGVMPVVEGFVQDMRDVAQGTSRRGAWAGYLPISHGDFYELVRALELTPDDLNIGWIITDEDAKKLEEGCEETHQRLQELSRVKMITGKGYLFFADKANRARPDMYKELNLDVKASNLCSEIMLHSDKDHTYTCVLSSMNVSKWEEWKDTDAVVFATVFLDCVVEEFLERARGVSGLENAVRFTEKGRALGLGQCGFHTLLQKLDMPFSGFEAHMLNNSIASHIKRKAGEATAYMAKKAGEPEWCKGHGVRNTHLLAIAPTKSTALIMGGVSEGINPDPAMAYVQPTSAGEMLRVNPVLLEIMKDRGVYNKKEIKSIEQDFNGSVQQVDWLSEEEKEVFKTAFEINQKDILRLASARQSFLDQGQSVNLFFDEQEDEEYISECLSEAWRDDNILALYYIYSKPGVSASKGECEACT